MKSLNRNDLQTIGDRIRWAIEVYLGETQAEYARKEGVKPQLLSRWINQQDRPPGEATIQKIAAATGVPAKWLRYGGPPPGTDDIPSDADPWLRKQIEKIEGGDQSEWQKTLRIDAVAALLFADASRERARALRTEAEAMRDAQRGATARAQAQIPDLELEPVQSPKKRR